MIIIISLGGLFLLLLAIVGVVGGAALIIFFGLIALIVIGLLLGWVWKQCEKYKLKKLPLEEQKNIFIDAKTNDKNRKYPNFSFISADDKLWDRVFSDEEKKEMVLSELRLMSSIERKEKLINKYPNNKTWIFRWAKATLTPKDFKKLK